MYGYDQYDKYRNKQEPKKRLRLQCAISQQKAWVASLTAWDGLLVT